LLLERLSPERSEQKQARERLEGRTAKLERDAKYFRDSLSTVCRPHTAAFDEERTYIYFVSETADRDAGRYEYSTRVTDGGNLAWRYPIPFSAGGDSERYSELSQLKSSVRCKTDGQRAVLLPALEDVSGLETAAFFEPLVADSPVAWSVRFQWPGLWNQLRADGSDSGSAALYGHFTTRFVLLIVFPDGTRDYAFESVYPKVGEREKVEYEGRPALRWTIPDPDGLYEYSVSAKLPGS
jgi:hypothetical protein